MNLLFILVLDWVNVEVVGEEVVDHLEVGGLGDNGVDADLHIGNDNHCGDGHPHAALQSDI